MQDTIWKCQYQCTLLVHLCSFAVESSAMGTNHSSAVSVQITCWTPTWCHFHSCSVLPGIRLAAADSSSNFYLRRVSRTQWPVFSSAYARSSTRYCMKYSSVIDFRMWLVYDAKRCCKCVRRRITSRIRSPYAYNYVKQTRWKYAAGSSRLSSNAPRIGKILIGYLTTPDYKQG